MKTRGEKMFEICETTLRIMLTRAWNHELTPDKIIEGTIEAVSREGAIKKVEEQGFFPIKLDELSAPTKSQARTFSKRVKYKKITIPNELGR